MSDMGHLLGMLTDANVSELQCTNILYDFLFLGFTYIQNISIVHTKIGKK